MMDKLLLKAEKKEDFDIQSKQIVEASSISTLITLCYETIGNPVVLSCRHNLCKEINAYNTTASISTPCTLCLETIVNPVVLSCRHNLCKDCAKDIREGTVILCPNCLGCQEYANSLSEVTPESTENPEIIKDTSEEGSTLRGDIKEILTCSICLGIWRNPQTLSCLHTYCIYCIPTMKKANAVQCGKCRECTPISHVKSNFIIEALISAYYNHTGKYPPSQTGSTCELQKAANEPTDSTKGLAVQTVGDLFIERHEEIHMADSFQGVSEYSTASTIPSSFTVIQDSNHGFSVTDEFGRKTHVLWRTVARAATEPKKVIHSQYRKVKSVNIPCLPYQMCVWGDEVWVAGADMGVFLCTQDLVCKRQIIPNQFSVVTSIIKCDTDVIVCDGLTGLHHLNQQGDYMNKIVPGHFSDACFTHNKKLYALEYGEGVIFVFCKSGNRWVQDTRFKLFGYFIGCELDKLCTHNTSVYVSSCYNHCISVYTHSGEFQYKTGECGEGVNVETGKFYRPLLGDVDSGGKLLVCDCCNNRLQVCDTARREWSEVSGVGRVSHPRCAGVGEKHLWVGTFDNKLLKYERN